jgi:hypothetical protein
LTKRESFLITCGWKLVQGKRIREKNGEPLNIDFCFIGNDAAHKSIAVVLQAQAKPQNKPEPPWGRVRLFYRRQKEGDFGLILNPTWGHPLMNTRHGLIHASAVLTPILCPSGCHESRDRRKDSQGAGLPGIKERSDLYREILATLHEQAVYLPLFYSALFESIDLTGLETSVLAGKNRYPLQRVRSGIDLMTRFIFRRLVNWFAFIRVSVIESSIASGTDDPP